MNRRRFNSSERVALYLYGDGFCAQCGCELEKGWHADHEIPFARGGKTDVANGQALCPDCNLKKGGTMSVLFDLFDWQANAIDLFIRNMATDFLCEATPAAGKTRVGAEIAYRLLTAKIVDYLVVVVPTRRLRKQVAQAFLKSTGLQLKYDWQPGDGAFPDGIYSGVIVTYQTIANNAALFRRHCNKIATLVVLDEIHHASHQQSWGIKLQEAFGDPARCTLVLLTQLTQ